MRIGPAGNVGIGTSTLGIFPGASRYLTLAATEFYTADMAALELQGASLSSSVPVVRIDFSSVGANGTPSNIARIHVERGATTAQGDMVFLTNNGTALKETMRIDKNGNVGIGTSTPGSKLDVAGSVAATDVDITKTTNATALDIQHSGLLTNPLVNIETSSGPPFGTNLLQIKAGSAIAADAQFVECLSGTDVKFRVNGDGDVTADRQFTGGGADFAEMVEVAEGHASVEPGDVMVISTTKDRALEKCTEANSTLIFGIYSTKPGFLGSERSRNAPNAGNGTAKIFDEQDMKETYNEVPVAVVGIVPCKVSAENGPVKPGDLLVTSATPGHAMKAPANPKVGTIVGKALGSLASGTGMIKVFVTVH